MPGGNHTNDDTDYSVDNPGPPPGATSANFMYFSLATASVGTALLLCACLWLESRPLALIGGTLALAGITGAFFAGRAPGVRVFCPPLQTGKRYFIPKNTPYVHCPDQWPLNCVVTFYEAGTDKVLATSAPITNPFSQVVLEQDGAEGEGYKAVAGGGYKVGVYS